MNGQPRPRDVDTTPGEDRALGTPVRALRYPDVLTYARAAGLVDAADLLAHRMRPWRDDVAGRRHTEVGRGQADEGYQGGNRHRRWPGGSQRADRDQTGERDDELRRDDLQRQASEHATIITGTGRERRQQRRSLDHRRRHSQAQRECSGMRERTVRQRGQQEQRHRRRQDNIDRPARASEPPSCHPSIVHHGLPTVGAIHGSASATPRPETPPPGLPPRTTIGTAN